MKRWFRIVGFTQAEGEGRGWRGGKGREPSKTLYRVQGLYKLMLFGNDITTNFRLTPVSDSAKPWKTVVHDWSV